MGQKGYHSKVRNARILQVVQVSPSKDPEQTKRKYTAQYHQMIERDHEERDLLYRKKSPEYLSFVSFFNDLPIALWYFLKRILFPSAWSAAFEEPVPMLLASLETVIETTVELSRFDGRHSFRWSWIEVIFSVLIWRYLVFRSWTVLMLFDLLDLLLHRSDIKGMRLITGYHSEHAVAELPDT